MKRTFRILAVVLAATMLMCCCAMATSLQKNNLRGYPASTYFASGYGDAYAYCGCTASGGSAATELAYPGPNRSVYVLYAFWMEGGEGNSTSNSMYTTTGTAYANAPLPSEYSSSNVANATTTGTHAAGSGSATTNDYYD